MDNFKDKNKSLHIYASWWVLKAKLEYINNFKFGSPILFKFMLNTHTMLPSWVTSEVKLLPEEV